MNMLIYFIVLGAVFTLFLLLPPKHLGTWIFMAAFPLVPFCIAFTVFYIFRQFEFWVLLMNVLGIVLSVYAIRVIRQKVWGLEGIVKIFKLMLFVGAALGCFLGNFTLLMP